MSKKSFFKDKLKACFTLIGLMSALFFSSCYQTREKIEPQLDYAVQDKYLLSLPSPFAPLTDAEKAESWSKEYTIGVAFAHELDLYQAITAFKRASILIPQSEIERVREINYGIFLCYFLGKKYTDAVYTYENSPLNNLDTSFPAAEDLLILLYDCYDRLGEDVKAERLLYFIQQHYPDAANKLYLYSNLLHADIPKLEEIGKVPSYEYVQTFIESYEKDKKSILRARHLNAIFPGAGYFYLGQTQSGITAVLLNGLFIAASYYFFDHGNIAAGAIFTSFEAGWYFGGIYGAGEEAKVYNERLYENKASYMMNEKGLFPGFMIKYAF
ncbi:MAG: tetratricopeptide repeat protein [Chlamydiae bacterium]|nr:tetratricopeptide repeat protein [Chlamydiota bacterium]